MSLLIDENLSDRLPRSLQDIFPDSFHVRGVGLESTDDDEIWAYARTQGLAIVTKDKDYFQLSLERGHPPKVVLIRTGNTPAEGVEALIRGNLAEINRFIQDEETALFALP